MTTHDHVRHSPPKTGTQIRIKHIYYSTAHAPRYSEVKKFDRKREMQKITSKTSNYAARSLMPEPVRHYLLKTGTQNRMKHIDSHTAHAPRYSEVKKLCQKPEMSRRINKNCNYAACSPTSEPVRHYFLKIGTQNRMKHVDPRTAHAP